METILNPALGTGYAQATVTTTVRSSLWTRFINYSKNQQNNRLLWLGVILSAHGCILTPLVIMLTLMAGPFFGLFMAGMVAMGIALVTNLAAMPTKITIPAFALSVLIDLGIVIACLAALLSR